METVLLKTQIAFIPIGIAMLLFSSIHAQIVYTDVNPDQMFSCSASGCNHSYNLDLNNDGEADFQITASTSSSAFPCSAHTNHIAGIHSIDSNEVQSSTINYADKLNLDTTINSSSPWVNGYSTTIFRDASWSSFLEGPCALRSHGSWSSDDPGYIALKLRVNGNIYYGWVELRVTVKSSIATFTIQDYAYSSIPNQSILAGQTCPPQSVIHTTGPTTFCAGDSVILASVNAGTNLSYKWKLNGSNITGATNKNYTAKVAGKYKVIVTDSTNGCSATSALVKVKVPCRTMNAETYITELKVYPNPASDKIIVEFPSIEQATFQLTNFLGQIVFSEKTNSAKEEIDVSIFPPGMYEISVSTDSKKYFSKFLNQ